MKVASLALPEVRLLVPERREDARGWVSATWDRSAPRLRDLPPVAF